MWPVRDAAGAVVDFEMGYTNPSAEKLMGVPLSSHQGARIHEAMPGLVPLGIYDRLIAVTETGTAESAEVELDLMWRDAIHVRGIWVHTVLPFGAGVMSVAFDVTEERRREQELRDFAAVAAHDLREPLIGMRLMAGVLSRRASLGGGEEQLVDVLDGGSQRALALVDSILAYATAERDSEARADVDAGAVVAEVLASLGPQIDEGEARIEGGALPSLRASADGLARVFQNLIANALKFRG